MSWFKKKDPNAIPPVNEQARSELLGTGGASGRAVSPVPPYTPITNADPYARPAATRYNSGDSNRGGGLPSGPAPSRDRYNRNNPVGDQYSRGLANLDQDRAELFAGYNPEKHKPSDRFTDGPAPPAGAGGGDEEDEVEGIKKQSRFLKQESVSSTRNALRIAREAEETARNTLGRLGDQSEKLANTERHLDISKGHVNRVEDKQDELKQLNRSIFRPVITFNKEGKRAAQETKLLQRHEDERDDHEKAMTDIKETQRRIGKARGFSGDNDEEDEESIGGYGNRWSKPSVDQATRKAERQRYQFEATASDDEMEDELDDNLGEISDMTKKLKALGTAMGQELDNQNSRLERLDGKATNLDNKLFKGTKRFERIK